MDEQGVKYNMIEPRNFGVTFPGRVYFAKREFVEKNKDLVQRFINTVCRVGNLPLKIRQCSKRIKKYDKALMKKEKEGHLIKVYRTLMALIGNC
ncbi:MAG: ABC transporter substrate-binding protein [Bacteroidetes bacterium]|nr:ABC transporter substrate-binding protein [Bacteroidota bacterium]